MPALRNSLNIRSRVMWVRAFFNTYKRRVIAAGGVIQNEPCAVRSFNNNLLRSASWTLVPSGIEEDIVFAQKPTSGLGDLTFTRASDATYTDASGVVRRSPYNLASWSEMFSDASWSKTGITVTPNVALAPNGTMTADRIQFSSANRALTQTTSLGTGVVCTASFYVLGTAGETLLFAAGGLDQLVTLTGSWQRISTTKTSINSTINVSTFGGATARDIFLWGAQLVEGTSALDYFPTTNRQDVPRIDFRNADGTLSSCGRLLLEPQRTNSIRNSSMVGAVAGSPGTLPTNWVLYSNGGLNTTVVGTGTENGLPYVDYRLNGTAAFTTARIGFDPSIASSNGQTWTESVYLRFTSGSNAASLRIVERNSGGTALNSGESAISVTSTLRRFTYTRTNVEATNAFTVPEVVFTLIVGQTYDFTIRIAAPQMELGAYATTWVPTTTAAVTRLADTAIKTGVSSLIGQTEGTLFFDINYTQNDVTLAQLFSISDGTSANRVFCGFTFNTSLTTTISTAGVIQFTASTSALVIGTRYKAAVAYKQNDFAFYVNGAQIAIDLSGTVGSFNRIAFDSGAGASQYTGLVNQAALMPTRLPNAQLAQLTTL